MSALAESGFSAAVFGPGWQLEHFSNSSPRGNCIAESVERSMWQGSTLPDELNCDCRKGKPHHTQDYQSNPIVRYARQYPVGSSSFFETDFRGAFELTIESEYSHFRPRLGSQAVLPHILPNPGLPPNNFLYTELPEKASQGLMIKVKVADAVAIKQEMPTKQHLRLCLYKLDMPADSSLEATFDFTAMQKRGQSTIGFYTAYKMPTGSNIEYQDSIIWYPYPGKRKQKAVNITSEAAGSRLVELGVFCTGHKGMVKHDRLLRVSKVTIKPKDLPTESWAFSDVRIRERQYAGGIQRRVGWTWVGSCYNKPRSIDLPWSNATGPFSHFVVVVGGKEIGEAYCNEFPLQKSDFDLIEAGGDVEVVIRGTLFGGGEVSSVPILLGGQAIASFQ